MKPNAQDSIELAWSDPSLFVSQAAEAEQARVHQAQEAWERFRDANCETTLESGFSPEGTMYSGAVLECEAQMTERRTEELKAYIRQMPIPLFSDASDDS